MKYGLDPDTYVSLWQSLSKSLKADEGASDTYLLWSPNIAYDSEVLTEVRDSSMFADDDDLLLPFAGAVRWTAIKGVCPSTACRRSAL